MFSHSLTVAPQQATRAAPDEIRALATRAFMHWLIDQMPFRAYSELLPTLLDMRDFYMKPTAPPRPALPSGKPFARVSRTTRAEVNIDEE